MSFNHVTSFSTNGSHPLVVLKFGGTALGAADVLTRAAELVARRTDGERIVVVVSAASGITDQLVQASDAVQGSDEDHLVWVDRIGTHYRTLARSVLRFDGFRRYEVFARVHLAALQRALANAAAAGAGLRERDEVLAAGERLMAPLAALLIEQEGAATTVVDAASLIQTDDTYGEAIVNRRATYTRLRRSFKKVSPRLTPVITGFIGSTEAGNTTTLGRGGTDYTAALVAAALRAQRLERWTDVDGLYTADPREYPNAEMLAQIPLRDAADRNRDGDLGMHARALDPLVDASIPIHVRSIFTPECPGTVLSPSCTRKAL